MIQLMCIAVGAGVLLGLLLVFSVFVSAGMQDRAEELADSHQER